MLEAPTQSSHDNRQASFVFPDQSMLPVGTILMELSASVPEGVFPSVATAVFPDIQPLQVVVVGDSPSVDVYTLFTWDFATDGNSIIRIFTSTAGGFFLD